MLACMTLLAAKPFGGEGRTLSFGLDGADGEGPEGPDDAGGAGEEGDEAQPPVDAVTATF